MRQKGFATIFALCLILVIALIVRSIQEAEANHAREVVNFETEQALQLAAESGIVEAADFVRQNPNFLPVSDGPWVVSKKQIPIHVTGSDDNITIEVWGERGKIYLYPEDKSEIKAVRFNTGFYPSYDGVYFMSRATIDKGAFGEKIYRRAFGYVHSEKQDDGTWKDDTTIHFMELPTWGKDYVTKT